jgi:shikimate kinase
MREKKGGNIYLIGFMGAGKSTVGRALAARLGRPFVDTDELIERQARQSIAAIFAKKGEGAFRLMEQRVIATVTQARGQVVAVGGGAVMDEGNWQRLQQSGLTVYLQCSPSLLAQRLAGDDVRPLLQGDGGKARLEAIARLLTKREPRYRQAKVVFPVNDGTSVEDLVTKLVEVLERENGNG